MEALCPALLLQMVHGNGKWEARGTPPGLPSALREQPPIPTLGFQFLSQFQMPPPPSVFNFKVAHPSVKFCQGCFESLCEGA